jgi:hypothetical protein
MADGRSFPCDGRLAAAARTNGTDRRLERAGHVSTLQQDRYGRRSSPGRRRLLLAAGGLALAAALAFVGWATINQQPTLNWDDVGYHVLSDAQVEVTFDVSFSAGGGSDSGGAGSGRPTAVCTVQALNPLRTEVGLKDVPVEAGPGGRVRATVTLDTSERATTGLVKSCTRTDR